jgi:hypothetical protein
LAAEVWLFAYGVHHLFQTMETANPDDIPTKAEFEVSTGMKEEK